MAGQPSPLVSGRLRGFLCRSFSEGHATGTQPKLLGAMGRLQILSVFAHLSAYFQSARSMKIDVNSAFNAEVLVAPPHAVAMEFDSSGRRSTHWVKYCASVVVMV
jgi:hypothetical protein